jgi:hypothetical protein
MGQTRLRRKTRIMSNRSSGEAMVDASKNIIIDFQAHPPNESMAGEADTHHHQQGCQLKVKMGLFQTGTFQKPRGYDPASSGGDYQGSIGKMENIFRNSACKRQ